MTPESKFLAEQMVEAFYSELEAYYISMMPNVNVVRRVAELMRLIALTEVGHKFWLEISNSDDLRKSLSTGART